jgi:hypothetical protein
MDEISSTKADLVGIPATCNTYYGLESPGVFRAVLCRVTFTADDVLSSCKSVEFVLRGEREYAIIGLAKALE